MGKEADIDTSKILSEVASSLDISPTDYARAVRSYKAVGQWLEDGFAKGFFPNSRGTPQIYPQGSIELGTIVRPIRDGEEQDFDVDLVCEIQSARSSAVPRVIKHQAGDCLKANEVYREKLDDEGRRCWTLAYAESEGIGFHMDVLPCVPYPPENHPAFPGAISITHHENGADTYSWKSGNPKGYASWFRDQDSAFRSLALLQKREFFEAHRQGVGPTTYASVEDVPNQLVRTPLQRAIQLMKRHRDLWFAKGSKHDLKYKPISIIITTLAAQLYTGAQDAVIALLAIVDGLDRYAVLIDKARDWGTALRGLPNWISRDSSGQWRIPNPVNSGENFADRWAEDNDARAKAFFDWARQLGADVRGIPSGQGLESVAGQLKRMFGERVSKAAVGRWGDSLRQQREAGNLRMSAGTGLLSSVGAIATRGHTFFD